MSKTPNLCGDNKNQNELIEYIEKADNFIREAKNDVMKKIND